MDSSKYKPNMYKEITVNYRWLFWYK